MQEESSNLIGFHGGDGSRVQEVRWQSLHCPSQTYNPEASTDWVNSLPHFNPLTSELH